MSLLRSFQKDARGTTAVMLGLAAPVLLLAVGGGIDMSRAAAQRQKIATALELACQQATHEIRYRQNQSGADPKANYESVVTKLGQDKVAAANLTGVGVTTTIASDVITIRGTGTSTNMFGGVIGFNTVSLSASRNCAKPPFPTSPGSGTPGTVLIVESFETNHNVASNSWTVLNNWNGWSTQSGKGGIEINGIPQLSGNEIRFGNFFAELDSHCYTSNCRTNSAMWRDVTLPETGDYELRYWYISRVRNPDYAGKVFCAYKDSTTAVRNAMEGAKWEGQTNRIDVYFAKTSGFSASSTTMVDSCVHTDVWTERRIQFKNLKKGDKYRMQFQAAGREDTYGGLIDYIRFCTKTCP